jgi:hypothetical protein
MATEDEKALIELQDRMLTSTQALARVREKSRVPNTNHTSWFSGLVYYAR